MWRKSSLTYEIQSFWSDGAKPKFERSDMMFDERMTRRDAIKRAAYITPVILTFLAAPAFASGGSGSDDRKDEAKYDGRYDGNYNGNYDGKYDGKYDGSEAGGNYQIFGGKGKRGQRWLWDEMNARREKK
jgi:hypothetical protein